MRSDKKILTDARAVLMRAAEVLDAGETTLCCFAIDRAVNLELGAAAHAGWEGGLVYGDFLSALNIAWFEALYSPYSIEAVLASQVVAPASMFFWSGYNGDPERQALRSLCLLFAAWALDEVFVHNFRLEIEE